MIFWGISNNYNGIQKYLILPGNKVPETVNTIVVYCLYSQWEKMLTFSYFLPGHKIILRSSDLGQGPQLTVEETEFPRGGTGPCTGLHWRSDLLDTSLGVCCLSSHTPPTLQSQWEALNPRHRTVISFSQHSFPKPRKGNSLAHLPISAGCSEVRMREWIGMGILMARKVSAVCVDFSFPHNGLRAHKPIVS